jgi:transposase-like protein
MSKEQSHSSAPRKPERNRKKKSDRDDPDLPPQLQQIFDDAVKEAAGKPLSMEKGSPLGRLIGAFVEHCLAEEINEHLGYQPHQRLSQSPSITDADLGNAEAQGDPPEGDQPSGKRRSNTRNGYSQKQLKTSMGSTTIAVPRDRAGEFDPQILPKHHSLSSEIEERVIAMYAHGVSSRDITEHIEQLYHFDVSENFVSRLLERVDPELTAWRNRPLESIYAIVYIDALHLKIRHSNGVASTAAYIVSGYGESGAHEVLGVWIAPSGQSAGHGESASFWHTVLVELNKRGVAEVLILASDGLRGIDQAVEAVYPSAKHLPCVVHQVRNSLQKVGATQRKSVAGALKQIYQAPSYQAAEAGLEQLQQQYGERYGSLVRQWEVLVPRLSVLWSYSEGLRRMVYTTNPQENLNRQVRKVTKTRSVLPSIGSALRLLTLALRDIDRRNAARRTRVDWRRIVQELQIHFPGRLPQDWGTRLLSIQ